MIFIRRKYLLMDIGGKQSRRLFVDLDLFDEDNGLVDVDYGFG